MKAWSKALALEKEKKEEICDGEGPRVKHLSPEREDLEGGWKE